MSIHFQAVTEKLEPHDTIFSFTSPAELNDTALSASCSLHTASASAKSSNDSLQPPGLAEITEDVCESQATTANNEDVNKVFNSPTMAHSTPKHVDQQHYINSDKENHRSVSSKHSASPASSSRTASNVNKALPPTPTNLNQETEKIKSDLSYDEFAVRPTVEGRPSSQSLRPTTRDLHSVHGYQPRLKLGPRPSTDTHVRLTAMDPSPRAIDTRPISTLPAGLRMPVRKAVPRDPESHQIQTDPRSKIDSAASVMQPAPSLPTTIPHTKALPAKPLPAPSSGIQGEIGAPVQNPTLKSPTMTPEKRRLMKALQLRQKQIAARSLQETYAPEPIPASPNDQPATKALPEDSIMKTVDIFSVDEDSNIVHFGTKIFDRELPANSEASPISVTEPSDGPSTQASSISDEEEASVKQEEPALLEKNSDQLASITPRSTIFQETSMQSHDASIIPEALTTLQGDKFPVEDDRTEIAQSEIESSRTQAPSSEERDLARTEPGSVRKSAPPTEPPSQRVSSLPKLATNIVSPQEVSLPAISEYDDLTLNALGLTYGEENALLPFIQPDAVPQVAYPHVASHPRDEDETWANTRPSTADTVAENRYRRNGRTRSVKRVSATSDENFLSDDSFMEELKYAVVQEAKPISVSKSPITPVFPRAASDQGIEQGITSRSVSNPLDRTSREDLLSPSQQASFSGRSFSIPESQLVEERPTQILLPTKVGVSSGISQRIKALEKLSSRPPSPSGSQLPSPAISPSFINLRKPSMRNTPPSSDPVSNSGHKDRQSVPYPSPSSSPEADSARHQNTSTPLETSGRPGKSRPESISVTARIIRGERNRVPEVPLNPAEPCAVDLYHSPLTVDHQPKEGMPKPTLSPLKPPTRRWPSNISISSSSTEHQSEPSKSSRRDSFMSRRSQSSRRGSDADLPRSISETSLATLTADGKRDEKKDSKKSRLFKRMSNISSASRRSIVQALGPSFKEESIAEHHEPVLEAPPTTIDVGDVNIQFPDTLVGNHSSWCAPLRLTIVPAVETPTYGNRPSNSSPVSLQSG